MNVQNSDHSRFFIRRPFRLALDTTASVIIEKKLSYSYIYKKLYISDRRGTKVMIHVQSYMDPHCWLVFSTKFSTKFASS